MVMENSWKMKNWQNVMEFCDQSRNFINCAHECCTLFADIMKFSISLESALYP